MPIDASIPLQAQPPQLPSVGELLTLRDLATRSQMNQLALAAAKRKQQADVALRGVYADPSNRDPAGNLTHDAIAKIDAIDPATGMQVRSQAALAAQRETATKANLARLQDAELGIYSKKTDMLHASGTAALTAYKDAVGRGVPDTEARRQAQQIYSDELGTLSKSGIFSEDELRGLPTAFDPQKLEAGLASTLKAKDYFAEETKRRGEASKAPTMRTRVQGTSEVQEEWDPATRGWKQVGQGPRFKPEEGAKAPAGYQWKGGKAGGELEPIPGGPATRKVAPTTVGDKMNPSMRASVELDMKEIDYGLGQIEGLKTKTAGPFFDEEHSSNALVRMFKKGMTPSDQQEYDTLANRFAMAIASIQSMGRGQISDAKIAEARKLVPVPGDSVQNVDRKLKVIRRLKEQAKESLDTPLKGGGQNAGEQIEDVLDFWNK